MKFKKIKFTKWSSIVASFLFIPLCFLPISNIANGNSQTISSTNDDSSLIISNSLQSDTLQYVGQNVEVDFFINGNNNEEAIAKLSNENIYWTINNAEGGSIPYGIIFDHENGHLSILENTILPNDLSLTVTAHTNEQNISTNFKISLTSDFKIVANATEIQQDHNQKQDVILMLPEEFNSIGNIEWSCSINDHAAPSWLKLYVDPLTSNRAVLTLDAGANFSKKMDLKITASLVGNDGESYSDSVNIKLLPIDRTLIGNFSIDGEQITNQEVSQNLLIDTNVDFVMEQNIPYHKIKMSLSVKETDTGNPVINYQDFISIKQITNNRSQLIINHQTAINKKYTIGINLLLNNEETIENFAIFYLVPNNEITLKATIGDNVPLNDGDSIFIENYETDQHVNISVYPSNNPIASTTSFTWEILDKNDNVIDETKSGIKFSDLGNGQLEILVPKNISTEYDVFHVNVEASSPEAKNNASFNFNIVNEITVTLVGETTRVTQPSIELNEDDESIKFDASVIPNNIEDDCLFNISFKDENGNPVDVDTNDFVFEQTSSRQAQLIVRASSNLIKNNMIAEIVASCNGVNSNIVEIKILKHSNSVEISTNDSHSIIQNKDSPSIVQFNAKMLFPDDPIQYFYDDKNGNHEDELVGVTIDNNGVLTIPQGETIKSIFTIQIYAVSGNVYSNYVDINLYPYGTDDLFTLENSQDVIYQNSTTNSSIVTANLSGATTATFNFEYIVKNSKNNEQLDSSEFNDFITFEQENNVLTVSILNGDQMLTKFEELTIDVTAHVIGLEKTISIRVLPTIEIVNEDEEGVYIRSSDIDVLPEELTIPNEMYGKKVVGIAKNGFKNCTNITNVICGSNLAYILDNAFENCANISTIKFTNNLKEIGAYAFNYCEKITKIIIPESVTKISDNAFKNMSGLKAFSVSEFNEKYFNDSNGILYGYRTDNSVSIIKCPEAVEQSEIIISLNGNDEISQISKYAFEKCLNINSITINSFVNYLKIEDYAFSSASSLTSVVFNGNISSCNIGNYAFLDCAKLNNLQATMITNDIKNTLIEKNVILLSCNFVGNYCFRGCESIQNIYLTSLISQFGDKVFTNCSNIVSLNNGINGIFTNEFVKIIQNTPNDEDMTDIDGEIMLFNNKLVSSWGVIQLTNEMNDFLLPQAFENQQSLFRINLDWDTSNSIYVQKNCFRNCLNLNNVTFDEKWSNLPNFESAFTGCSNTSIYVKSKNVDKDAWSENCYTLFGISREKLIFADDTNSSYIDFNKKQL